MSFNLEVYVLNLKKGGGSWMLYDIQSVGLWDGKEITNAKDCPSGIITDISTQFEQMTKAKPDKPKPMTITWEPSKENKLLFASTLRKAKFELIRFTVNCYAIAF